MKLQDLLNRSWKNVLKSRTRFILTSLSLAVGAFTVSLTLAMGTGIRNQLQDFGSGIRKDAILITERDSEAAKESDGLRTTDEAASSRSTEPKGLSTEDVDKIKKIEGVREVQPISYAQVDEVEFKGRSYDTPAATLPLTFNQDPSLIAGKVDDIGTDGVFVPESFVKEGGFANAEELIGKKISLVWTNIYAEDKKDSKQSVEATIRGVIKAGPESSYDDIYMAIELNEKIADIQYNALASLRGSEKPRGYQYINVFATSDDAVKDTTQRIREAGYSATSIAELNDQIIQGINLLQSFFLGIAAIAILAAIFGVINTQYMAVYERTREIGVMKALGLSRRGVLLLFAIEAAWIGVAGSVIGIVLSLPLILYINTGFKDVIGANTEGPLAAIAIENILIIVVVLAAIALLAGLLPARKAARLNPVDALRVE